MRFLSKTFVNSLMAALMLLMSGSALAYVGPGSGLSAIGSFLALIVAIVVAIFGFVWFPLKRMFGKKQPPKEEVQETELREGVEE